MLSQSKITIKEANRSLSGEASARRKINWLDSAQCGLSRAFENLTSWEGETEQVQLVISESKTRTARAHIRLSQLQCEVYRS